MIAGKAFLIVPYAVVKRTVTSNSSYHTRLARQRCGWLLRAISTYLTTGTESPPKSIGRQRYRESARQPGRHWSAKKYTLSPTTRGKALPPNVVSLPSPTKGEGCSVPLSLFCRPRTCVPYWAPTRCIRNISSISAVFLKQDRSLVVSGRENAYIFACMGVANHC